MSNEKNPSCLGFSGGIILPSCMGIIISQPSQVEMLLSMEPSGRLLLSPSRGAASRKTDAATRNCGGDPVNATW